jgi:hypothetical protein
MADLEILVNLGGIATPFYYEDNDILIAVYFD